jgi:hypothetical protein
MPQCEKAISLAACAATAKYGAARRRSLRINL